MITENLLSLTFVISEIHGLLLRGFAGRLSTPNCRFGVNSAATLAELGITGKTAPGLLIRPEGGRTFRSVHVKIS
ncbi:hypothetical protein Hesp01_41050 [Herbidospora sp. NBRC 101105]|nr:hypothetical protein Hesp01_41050 [Herbidospora sp. NBRC 101105]